MAVTIKDIARLAGVSIATVSRVINNTKPVHDETRQRILSFMDELNFRPNAMARGLVKKESNLLGIVIPEFKDTVFDAMIEGVSDTAKLYNYDILLTLSRGDLANEIHYLNLLREKQVDGIIFSSISLKKEHIEIIEQSGIPCVLVGQVSTVPTIPSIHLDNFSASYEAVTTLIHNGHHKIGMIRGALDDIALGQERFRGFQVALTDTGIKMNTEWVIAAGLSVRDGYEAMERMSKTKSLPTALFAATDRIAIGAMNFLLEHGYRIPEDISIMGFDDIDMSTVVRPKLSTVQYSSLEIGHAATHSLMQLVRGEGVSVQHTNVPYQIVIRQSTRSG